MYSPSSFWSKLDDLVRTSKIRVERSKGSYHPRYPEQKVTAVAVCVDLLKRDLEFKILIGCTEREQNMIRDFHNKGAQGALIVSRKETLC